MIYVGLIFAIGLIWAAIKTGFEAGSDSDKGPEAKVIGGFLLIIAGIAGACTGIGLLGTILVALFQHGDRFADPTTLPSVAKFFGISLSVAVVCGLGSVLLL